jgi:AbrB family looped-hinge helix DNA binding protein
MAEVTLSTKNQIVIPREARKALHVKPGDKLVVVVRGTRVIVLQKPESHHAAVRGIGRGVYPPDYNRKERRSWDWRASLPSSGATAG